MVPVGRSRCSSEPDQGAAMVEFALVLPILLILLFGIIDFGLYFYNDLQLTQAARDAARYASVHNIDWGRCSTIADAEGRLVSSDHHLSGDRRLRDPGRPGHSDTDGRPTRSSPLCPALWASANSIGINATAIMRRE